MSALALPTTREEDWKYTDLSRLAEIQRRWLESGSPAGEPDHTLIQRVTSAVDADWIVFSTGELLADVSPGLAVEGIEAKTSAAEPHEDDSSVIRLNATQLRSALDLNVVGDLSSGKPIGLLFADSGQSGALVASSRVTIRLSAGAKARFIEYHASSGDAEQVANNLVRLDLKPAAVCDYVRMQERSLSHDQLARIDVSLAKDSSFRHLGIDLGGRLTRNDLNVDIAARGASAEFNGVYVVADGQHTDNHTRADHRVGPAQSRQEYRGILSGRSRAVWNGKAYVHKGADGTDAEQANHNLLLTEKAEIDAKPELEIYADDVKCAHGTTVGQLDESALFYLKTRGISDARARRILTRAFAATVVDKCPVVELKDLIGQKVEQRLREITEGSTT